VTGGELETSKHLSVLALAPIPLLVVLGHSLSNKVQTDFFQCHRDRPERWTWHEDKPAARYISRRKRAGTEPGRVAVMLSLSGTVAPQTLPSVIDESFTVYEITLDGATPHPGFLQQREDLDAFRQVYRQFLAEVTRESPRALRTCTSFRRSPRRSPSFAALTSCRRLIRRCWSTTTTSSTGSSFND